MLFLGFFFKEGAARNAAVSLSADGDEFSTVGGDEFLTAVLTSYWKRGRR